MRRLIVFTALLCTAFAIGATSASAKVDEPVVFEAPGGLLNPQTREATFATLDSLGVKALRVVLHWNDVAPDRNSRDRPSGDLADPSRYDWSNYAEILDEAQARGWPVLLTVSSPVPRWGTQGAIDHLTRPRASDFQTFMTAVGKRFGSQVTWWSIWNEPNHPNFLLPQFDAKSGKALSPGIYRGLFLAARAGLNAAGLQSATVVAGETAPRANSKVVGPLPFLRGVLCLSESYKPVGKCSKLPADGWADHPYPPQAGPFFVPSNKRDVTIGVLSRLSTALDKAAKAGAIAKHTPIYATEFGVQSVPDKAIGVSLSKQSDNRSISEHIAWSNSRVAMFSQYLLQDDPPRGCTAAQLKKSTAGITCYSGFESGLETWEGKKKPVFDSFRIPLVATPRNGKISLWGLVRPATGVTQVAIERAAKGSSTFKPLTTVTTKADGSWTATTSGSVGPRWRVKWTSPDGFVYVGPPTRAYAK